MINELKNKAVQIKTDGTNVSVLPENGTDFTLEELQKMVGGYIEIISLGKVDMVVNEEGRIKGLSLNPTATLIAKRLLGCSVAPIMGDVVICKREMIK